MCSLDIGANPVVIQGGMGVAVSTWRLARSVGCLGQLGVVSGVALDLVHARRLADGDRGGHLRRAYAEFPVAGVAERVLDRWFIDGGRAPDAPYKKIPAVRLEPSGLLTELTVLANFAEVWLAKAGHGGPIGVNYLEKVQLPTPHAAYGALLAGVDYVLMGAGIPAAVPQLLAALARGEAVSYRISVDGAARDEGHSVRFDPAELFGAPPPRLHRARFLAIVSSNTLATFLAKDPLTRPDGFVVETSRAGGHNAPPRGRVQLDPAGEPVYGPRDDVDVPKLAGLGLPYWLAGGYGDPEALRDALAAGAAGVQVGTAFALCEESALPPTLKREVIRTALEGTLRVTTDPRASPSGYPFKVADVAGTVADPGVYERRQRICDLGFLRVPYKQPDGSIGYRCPSEPVDDYLRKGGKLQDTVGRKCLCNALMATAGMGQVRPAGAEPPLVTIGDDAVRVVRALAGRSGVWSAADVVSYLLAGTNLA